LGSDPDVFKSWAETWDEDLNLIVPNDMQIVDEVDHAEMGRLIREIYTGGEPFADNLGAGIRVSIFYYVPRLVVTVSLVLQ
jgi:hypothetical protein